MRDSFDQTIIDERTAERDALVKALEQCAAGFTTPPGTFNEVAKYIHLEFARRMELAGDALAVVGDVGK